MMRNIKFADLFAGIGGFRMAMEAAGARCIFSSEWDRFAQRTYAANFGETSTGNIREIEAKDIPDHDVLCAGFPCPAFSLAGVSKRNSLGRAHGFKDDNQGTLFFEIIRILQEKKPQAIFLENVKHITRHDNGRTFKIVQESLESAGYHLRYDILDASDYVPQRRLRVFMVGFRNPAAAHAFGFPRADGVGPVLRTILFRKVDAKYQKSDKSIDGLNRHRDRQSQKGNGFGYSVADPDGISRTLMARYYKDGSEILIPVDWYKDPRFRDKTANPRKLTPRECARLQGYPDSFVIPVSDTQAYKQFGNSVTLPLVMRIAENLVLAMEN